MNPPTPQKQVRTCIGAIHYHLNMWPRQSHTLATLTILKPIKNKFKWMKMEQYDFEKNTWIVARDTLLNCQNSNKTFKIHTDDSALQLGAVIIQKGKPISFYI